jgi:ParB-like chromosome segregation protein Spo0J
MVMHMHAVKNADLKYPIILDEDGEIMDGRHRIMKALYLGVESIKAVRFDANPSPCEITKD